MIEKLKRWFICGRRGGKTAAMLAAYKETAKAFAETGIASNLLAREMGTFVKLVKRKVPVDSHRLRMLARPHLQPTIMGQQMIDRFMPGPDAGTPCVIAAGHSWGMMQSSHHMGSDEYVMEYICQVCGTVHVVTVKHHVLMDMVEVSTPPPKPEVFYLDNPVIGFRQWRLTMDEDNKPILASVSNSDGRWPGPIIHAHKKPELHVDHVGLYAMKPICAHWNLKDPGMTVCGDVEMWGTVIEHEHGYKAEHARIVRLYVHPGGWVPWEDSNSIAAATRAIQRILAGSTLSIGGTALGTVTDVEIARRGQPLWYRSDAPAPWRFPDWDLYTQLADRYQIDEVMPLNRPNEQVLGNQLDRIDREFEAWLVKNPHERENVRQEGEYSRYLQSPTEEDIERYGKADEHEDRKTEADSGGGAAGTGHGPFGAANYDALTGSFTFTWPRSIPFS